MAQSVLLLPPPTPSYNYSIFILYESLFDPFVFKWIIGITWKKNQNTCKIILTIHFIDVEKVIWKTYPTGFVLILVPLKHTHQTGLMETQTSCSDSCWLIAQPFLCFLYTKVWPWQFASHCTCNFNALWFESIQNVFDTHAN